MMYIKPDVLCLFYNGIKKPGELMETGNQQLKFKLDITKEALQYYKLQEQWENEGGATFNQAVETYLPESLHYLKPGDCFRVLDSRIELINEEVFYIVDVAKYSESKVFT